MADESSSAASAEDYDDASWLAIEQRLVAELPFGESDSEDEDEEKYYFILAKPSPGGDIFQATRVGDKERVRHLLGHPGTNINRRDAWDCPPLYYACLAGHYEVAELLLEGGAICNEHTFDGDRVHYVALNLPIRSLLRQYEARPPPLSPLAASLRQACTFCSNPEATDQNTRPLFADLVFILGEERFELHRAILAARSAYCRKMLKSSWHTDRAGEVKEVTVGAGRGHLSKEALRAVITYLYTDRLDVDSNDAMAVEKFARKLRCDELSAIVAAEAQRQAIKFKRARVHASKRLVVPPGAVPPNVQLASQLRELRSRSCRLEADGHVELGNDFADVALVVQGHAFRCHRVILAARSDYFAALLQRTEATAEGPSLPTIQLGDITPDLFETVLTFAYTHEVPAFEQRRLSSAYVESLLDAADMYLLDAMKKGIADAVLNNIEQGMRAGRSPSLEHLLRLLLAAERSGVSVLRDSCLVAVAKRFDAMAGGGASSRECSVLSEFIRSVSPQGWSEIDDLLQFATTADDAAVAGASKGNIEGSGIGGLGAGTLLQDLREAYLEHVPVAGVHKRDEKASLFDKHLQEIAAQSVL